MVGWRLAYHLQVPFPSQGVFSRSAGQVSWLADTAIRRDSSSFRLVCSCQAHVTRCVLTCQCLRKYRWTCGKMSLRITSRSYNLYLHSCVIGGSRPMKTTGIAHIAICVSDLE